MKLVCLFIIMMCQMVLLHGQEDRQTLRGIVLDAETKEPIAGVTVYVNNTTLRTGTNEKGEFVLQGLYKGVHQVVVSALSYETLLFNVAISDKPLVPRKIMLDVKTFAMDEVVISRYNKKNWQKWGAYFLEKFIGTSANAKKCKLLNYKDLRFSFNAKKNLLTVTTVQPLQIKNEALGYLLRYDLVSFEADFKSKITFYYGYPVFEEMKGSKDQYAANRIKAYKGSKMQFFRSLYHNTILEDGFEIYPVILKENREKQRVKKIQAKQINSRAEQQKGILTMVDSSAYYNRILSEPDTFRIINNARRLSAHDLVTERDGRRILQFNRFLQVCSLGISPEKLYLTQNLDGEVENGHPLSILEKIISTPMEIDVSGNYSEVRSLLESGYWGWQSNVANLLPQNYSLDPKQN